jgi:Fic-DOC domain mobile mystery protein B
MIKLTYTFGSTPLDPNETNGLIPKHISTQSELNEWEESNILEAENWVFSLSNIDYKTILTIDFSHDLHKKMFNKTWRWAGTIRKTNKNIGVDHSNIRENLKQLLGDVEYQIMHNSFPIDETAARFHHRLVSIHLFPNGNGRHARLITDVLMTSLNQEPFTWGKENLVTEGNTRKKYIQALRDADRHDYSALLKFIRA